MQDKIFSVFGESPYEINNGLREINKILEKNENYEIKFITSVSKTSEHPFAGVIIVIGERKKGENN